MMFKMSLLLPNMAENIAQRLGIEVPLVNVFCVWPVNELPKKV